MRNKAVAFLHLNTIVKYRSAEESNAAQNTLRKTKFRIYIGKDDEITRDMTRSI
jgi:hypothetical protein